MNKNGKGGFKSGQSGNPTGRPLKDRALTEVLKTALNAKSDKGIAHKRILADLITQGLTTGKVDFGNGTELTLTFDQWVDFGKWLYSHVDGPVRQQLELSGGADIGLSVAQWLADRQARKQEVESLEPDQ